MDLDGKSPETVEEGVKDKDDDKLFADNHLILRKMFTPSNLFLFFLLLILLYISLQNNDENHSLYEYIPNMKDGLNYILSLFSIGILLNFVIKYFLPEAPARLNLLCSDLNLNSKAYKTLYIGFVIYLILYLNLKHKAYSHWDVLLFFASIIIFGYAVNSFDGKDNNIKINLTWKDIIISFAICIFFSIINSNNLGAWQFAWICDEYPFFEEAQHIIKNNDRNFFNLLGVYNVHPFADSMYQALIMKIFGNNIIGWRFSVVLLISISSGMIYLLGTILFGRLEGIAAAVLLGSSHYLMVFNYIGTNNNNCVFMSILVILMLVLAGKSRRAVFLYATGCAMGFCFYTFMSSILTLFVVTLVLVIEFFQKPSKNYIRTIMFMAIGFFIVIFPAFVVTPSESFFGQVFFQSWREESAVRPDYVAKVCFIKTFCSFFTNDDFHHYIGGPIVDRITGILLALGLIRCLLHINKCGERVILLWYIIGLLCISGTYYVPVLPMTRLMYLFPSVVLISSIGFSGFCRVFIWKDKLYVILKYLFIIILLISIYVLNLCQLFILSPKYLGTNHVIRTIKCLQEYKDVIISVVKEDNTEGDHIFLYYPWFTGRYYKIPVDGFELSYPFGVKNSETGIYAAFDEDIARYLLDKLPKDKYFMIKDFDSINNGTSWLFIPKKKNYFYGIDNHSMIKPEFISQIVLPEANITPDNQEKSSMPSGIALDNEGNMYVICKNGNKVYKYTPEGKLLAGMSMEGELSNPVFYNGILYICDSPSNKIMAFDRDLKKVNNDIQLTISNFKTMNFNMKDDKILAIDGEIGKVVIFDLKGNILKECEGEFCRPADAVINSNKEIFVLDTGNNKIKCLSSEGKFIRDFDVETSQPCNLAIDSQDRLYFAIPNKRRVSVYDKDGKLISSWKQLLYVDSPEIIFIDKENNCYIIHQKYNMIQRYRLYN